MARGKCKILRRRGGDARRLPLGLVLYSAFYLALYRMYKEQGKAFVPKYLALLEAGGSDTPETLLKPLGVDIHDPAFWQKGIDEIKSLVGKLQETI